MKDNQSIIIALEPTDPRLGTYAEDGSGAMQAWPSVAWRGERYTRENASVLNLHGTHFVVFTPGTMQDISGMVVQVASQSSAQEQE